MSFKLIGSAFLISAMAFACGGGDDGVSDVEIGDLSDPEIMDACESLARPARTVDCGGGVVFTIGGDTAADIADCVDNLGAQVDANPNCTATVGDFEDCFDAIFALTDAQICDDATPEPAACVPLDAPECSNQPPA